MKVKGNETQRKYGPVLMFNILYYEGDLFEISDGKEHYLFLSEHRELLLRELR